MLGSGESCKTTGWHVPPCGSEGGLAERSAEGLYPQAQSCSQCFGPLFCSTIKAVIRAQESGH